jgi:4-diphosphocytidyl-2-C-methyl-D-erythritol kinase
MTLYDLPAPAKLNLFLHIIGQRSDGYHMLQSVFRLISLSDSITIDLRRDAVISRQSNREDQVQEQEDLVVKAARLLQKATGTHLGAHISVTKRIPMGAGLGGGSSDAATVLLALNRLWRTGLKRAALSELGLVIGADVPFFLGGQNAFVQGIGQELDPIDISDASYLLLKPKVSVATARVFAAPDLTRDTEPVKMLDFSGCDRFVGSSDGHSVKEPLHRGFGRNDMEPVVKQMFPEVRQAMDWVVEQGYQVRMSGSGSCFFAEFGSPEEAELAKGSLVAKMQDTNQGFDGALIKEVLACDGWRKHPLRHWVDD